MKKITVYNFDNLKPEELQKLHRKIIKKVTEGMKTFNAVKAKRALQTEEAMKHCYLTH